MTWGVMVPEDERYIGVKDAAKLLRVSEDTVRELFDAGELTGFRTPRGGHRRIAESSAEALFRRMHGHTPDGGGAS